MKKRPGLTFIRFLIVLVVLIFLGGLIAWVVSKQAEKVRTAEALSVLGSARESMLRYFAENGTYVGAAIPKADTPFSYALEPAPTETTFTIVATRGSQTISINEAGEVTKNGIS